MHTICKEISFAAAHRIDGHPGKCRNLHGHTYRVRVWVGAEALDELGMVLDFGDLRKMLEEVVEPFDHRLLNEVPPFDRRSTTAEHLSEYFFRELAERLAETGARVVRVEVWESPSSCATFEPDR